jgi:formylglycine-generating enzyme required for sulfatase activity
MLENAFITVPETKLPCGLIVPSFQVGQFAASKSADGKVASNEAGIPWTRITYDEARQACADSGFDMVTETQWLALAWDVVNQPCNWTKGEVGKGKLFRGLRYGTVMSPQPGNYVSPDEKERRWLTLSNGERICDLNGNVWQWVFDDLDGDKDGVLTGPKDPSSPSFKTAPYPSEKKGMGFITTFLGRNGSVPVRGGYWSSAAMGGVFALLLSAARSVAYNSLGFRPALKKLKPAS